MKASPKFDIVVYGATGFTCQLVAEYLAQHYTGQDNPKWAMAGRSLDKLASVRDAIGAPADTALIKADASDSASLKAMIDQTKSVLSTVGPLYRLPRSLWRAGVDASDDRRARGRCQGERRAHRLLLWLRLGAVRTRRILRAGGSQAG